MIGVIFVCLGNICRSPMAEAVFTDLVEKAGLGNNFSIDSAGTGGYHVGEAPHPGTTRVLAEHDIVYRGRAKKFKLDDWDKFDYIVAMDSENLSDLQYFDRRKTNRRKLHRLLDFARYTTTHDVPDPYYARNFEHVYELVLDGCQGLLAHIRAEHNL
ncbi:MAG: low molecular weight protein-tyrosine-phosphatase [Anaerolineae bacterium]